MHTVYVFTLCDLTLTNKEIKELDDCFLSKSFVFFIYFFFLHKIYKDVGGGITWVPSEHLVKKNRSKIAPFVFRGISSTPFVLSVESLFFFFCC